MACLIGLSSRHRVSSSMPNNSTSSASSIDSVMRRVTSGIKNNGSGVLSGYAWGDNVGWINFVGVSINSNGYFSGAASGDVSGQIRFSCLDGNGNDNCQVLTTWRPGGASTISGSGGGANLFLQNLSKPVSAPGSTTVITFPRNLKIGSVQSIVDKTGRDFEKYGFSSEKSADDFIIN